MIKPLSNLYIYLKSSFKHKINFYIFLTFISSLIEGLSIGLIVPYLNIIQKGFLFYENSLLNLSIYINILEATIIYIIFIIFSALFRFIHLRYNLKLAYDLGAFLSNRIYRNLFNMNYLKFKDINSSEILDVITNKVSMVVGAIIIPLFNIIANSLSIIVITIILLFFNFKFTFLLIISYVSFYFLLFNFNKKTLNINSSILSKNTSLLIKYIQESIFGFKDIKINNSKLYFINLFEKNMKIIQKIHVSNQIIFIFPKFIMELIGLIFIILLIYNLNNDFLTAVSIVALYGLASQRLLPLLQQSYASVSSIKSNSFQLDDVLISLQGSDSACLNLISDQSSLINPLIFKKNIVLSNISFEYENILVLNKINLIIKKNSMTAITGATGSGKTTLIDIIMRLLDPVSGDIFVDGESLTILNEISWRKNISHVPQNIFISDDTLLANIAFGLDSSSIDLSKIEFSLEKSGLKNFVNSLPDGLRTRMNEDGSRLSGGQKQRIGIARALYRNTDIIILDEPTSALDNTTTLDILIELKKLSHFKTILVITHDSSNLNFFDQIFTLN